MSKTCCNCGKKAEKKWGEDSYCLECWINEADKAYYDNGRTYKRIPKKLFIK